MICDLVLSLFVTHEIELFYRKYESGVRVFVGSDEILIRN